MPPEHLTKWRNIRRMLKEQILSLERLNASQELCQQKVKQLCDYVLEHSINRLPLNISAAAFTTSLNFLSNTLFSIDFDHYDSHSSKELDEIISGLRNTMGKPNLADFFPGSNFLIPRVKHQTEFYTRKLFGAFEDIITQRLQERGTSHTSSLRKNDFLEVLLDLCQQHEAEWSHNDVKHILLDSFIGELDTATSTVEWAMVELLRNPEKMEKARAEFREVVGLNKLVQESDTSRLSYLHAIVKKTLRLHPLAPLLPHELDNDIEIDHYILPKNSQIIFNIWTMGRDSRLWSNPHSFVPGRFLDSKIDYKGQHFEFLPFGTGRRIGLGISLTQRMLQLMLASLLHNFDWKLEDGITPEDVNMSQRSGLTLQKAVPFEAFPIRCNV